MTDAILLLCTVGGSPEPIISAIRTRRPAHIVFVCSDGTDGPSSAASVPGIVAATGLSSAEHEILTVPADDPDAAIHRIRERLPELRRHHAASKIVADYTGGTKSMSAALLHVAVAAGLTAQFMAGLRRDLAAVAPGTERPRILPLDLAIAERRVTRLVEAWSTYGYEEAAHGFAAILSDLDPIAGVPPSFRNRVTALCDLSHGFAAWDRFDHAGALRLLEPFCAKFPAEIGAPVAALRRLADPATREPAILFDLWLNAERSAARGRYDDATARLYRLVEGMAQWLLRRFCGIDTSDVDLSRVPDKLRRHLQIDQQPVQAAMGQAWSLVEGMLTDHPIRAFMRSKAHATDGKIQREHRNRWARARNYSILAHGHAPIDGERWQREILPFPTRLVVALEHEVATMTDAAGRHAQLPRRPPDALCS